MRTSDPESVRHAAAAIVLGTMVTVIAVLLGNWQMRRGDAKEALQVRRDAAESAAPVTLSALADLAETVEPLPRRVRAAGVFIPEATVFVDNRPLEGRAGFQVVTPLRIAGDAVVLVSRGWVARDLRDPAAVPRVGTPDGAVEIEGMAVERVPRLMELARPQSQKVPGIWPNLDFDAYQQAAGLKVARFVVQQTSEQPDGLKRIWPRPDYGVHTHRGYAFQWFGLALLAGGLTLFFGWRAFGPKRL